MRETLTDLVHRISVHRNLDSTVQTFNPIDVPVWEKLLRYHPDRFLDLAAYGYRKRHGQRYICDEELKDFAREIVWKFYLIQMREMDLVPRRLAELPVFDLTGTPINYLV